MPFKKNKRSLYYPNLAQRLGYSNQNVLVIVNIDDIGLHKDETEASFNAFKFGMIKSGTLMVPCPNFIRAIDMWSKNPEIDLGIHLTLTCEWGEKYPWSPVLSEVNAPTLYNKKGNMWQSVEELLQKGKINDIEKELEAQIHMVLDTGFKPSHLTCHMVFHEQMDLLPIVIELSRKYRLPLRVPKRRIYKLPLIKNNLWSLYRRGHVFSNTFMGLYTMSGQDQSLEYRKNKYHDYLRSLHPGVHVINVHISFQTEELINIMGLHATSIRQIDYDVWTSEETKELAKEIGIIFISFKPLQKIQEKLMEHI